MKKDKLYLFTFIAIAIIFLIVAIFTSQYFIKLSANQLIEVQVESCKREAKEVSSLIDFQISSGIKKEQIKDSFQKIILKSESDTWFISVFDWSGKQICHPNITKVGQKITSNQSLLNSLKDKNNSDDLYNLLVNSIKNNTVTSDINSSEIIHIVPVVNSDWIVAAHVNIANINNQMRILKNNFYWLFSIMGALVIILSFIAVRVLGSKYENQLELKNTNLESEVLNLSKLNTDLVSYKEKIIATSTKKEVELEGAEKNKKRILTYIRNELVPILIKDIAYIYTENTITYIVCFNGKKSTSNFSLEDIFSSLDPTLFFRANRQYIICITGIDKIIKYGNSQLKILIQSNNTLEIIISKNKAAEFKQWLNI